VKTERYEDSIVSEEQAMRNMELFECDTVRCAGDERFVVSWVEVRGLTPPPGQQTHHTHTQLYAHKIESQNKGYFYQTVNIFRCIKALDY
jgi:phosphatidylethanolamine-binding protein (PEBP) family uncharacterized protein